MGRVGFGDRVESDDFCSVIDMDGDAEFGLHRLLEGTYILCAAGF